MTKEVRIENWPNGKRKFETPYTNGKRHGIEKWWYKNGQKERETTYVNGQRHGLSKWWHENGQKEAEISYVNGQFHSLSKWWHFNGSLKYSGKWHQGQQVWTMQFSSEEQIPTDAEVELFFHPTPELS